MEIRRGAHDPNREPLVSFSTVNLSPVPAVISAMIRLPILLPVSLAIRLLIGLALLSRRRNYENVPASSTGLKPIWMVWPPVTTGTACPSCVLRSIAPQRSCWAGTGQAVNVTFPTQTPFTKTTLRDCVVLGRFAASRLRSLPLPSS